MFFVKLAARCGNYILLHFKSVPKGKKYMLLIFIIKCSRFKSMCFYSYFDYLFLVVAFELSFINYLM